GVRIAGMDSFPKWPLLEGAQFAGPSNFGKVLQPSNPLSGKEPLLYSAGDATIKYIITRDPKFDTLHFDPRQYKARIATVASIMDVTDQSLARFRAKGGKIIMTHGTADDFITPHNSIAYYERQLAHFGQKRLRSFLRFYLIPGFSHGFGAFNAKFDALPALEQWVQSGRAPAGLVAMDGNRNVHRTRPLCEYPKYPKFIGAPGTENSAESFTCVDQ
ncbi:MAG: tannase/feruloyl esterase family alpha/beta hydrolase, partial [Steroidobacteraceae bacterium]